MDGTVINLLDPGPEPGVEILQIMDTRDLQLTQELVAESPMPAFQFALALGRIRSDTLISTQSVHSVVLIKYYKN